MSSTQLTYRPMAASDLGAVAKARSEAAEFGLLSKVDSRFWRHFFAAILDSPITIAYVAYETGGQELAGYIVGVTSYSRLKRLLLARRFLPISWYLWRMMIKDSAALKKLLSAVVLKQESAQKIPEARWVSWVVCAPYRKSGVGFALYRLLCTEMLQKGQREFYGPVDCSNAPSNKAHEKMGAENLGVIQVEGRPHYLWRHFSQKWKI